MSATRSPLFVIIWRDCDKELQTMYATGIETAQHQCTLLADLGYKAHIFLRMSVQMRGLQKLAEDYKI